MTIESAATPRLSGAPPSGVVTLRSVNVAKPSVIGRHRGHPVTSGIRKRAVAEETRWLDTVNLDGDQQADLVHHGGPDKAVYAYPSEHLPVWSAELGADPPFGPGAFGENLTIAGWLEDAARIGDVWAWGDARLQIAQPRYPCYKLGIAVGAQRVVKRFVQTARTGWYLRVLEPGEVPLAGPIAVIDRDPAGVSVRDAFRARVADDATREELEAALACDALAASWRKGVLERLSG